MLSGQYLEHLKVKLIIERCLWWWLFSSTEIYSLLNNEPFFSRLYCGFFIYRIVLHSLLVIGSLDFYALLIPASSQMSQSKQIVLAATNWHRIVLKKMCYFLGSSCQMSASAGAARCAQHDTAWIAHRATLLMYGHRPHWYTANAQSSFNNKARSK